MVWTCANEILICNEEKPDSGFICKAIFTAGTVSRDPKVVITSDLNFVPYALCTIYRTNGKATFSMTTLMTPTTL